MATAVGLLQRVEAGEHSWRRRLHERTLREARHWWICQSSRGV